ncbi:MAG: Cobalt-precorrin-6A reductase [Chroococcopsis gigantea SAG 12.99]|jgi:precorrin-6A/cobalt-precorrin-6A reductase|nr:Cobalt-precorrin-6A reductase [Chroococcopsis gigantea SAG 12.99]
MTIWLIGGTSESVSLSKALSSLSLPCVISVTTPAALDLYPSHPCLKVVAGFITPHTLSHFCIINGIKIIIDASHPYAVEISRLAMSCDLPYLRYERKPVEGDDSTLELDSFPALLDAHYLAGERVLLTVGCKALGLFKAWHDRSCLFARVLPVVNSIIAAGSAGFTSDRLIALRPPIGEDLERAIWLGWNISTVVTKANGAAGGEEVKRKLARELGVSLIVIRRPPVIYPRQTDKINDVISFCKSYYSYV